MPTRKVRSAAKTTPARIKFLLGLLFFVSITGIAAVKFFHTTRGMVLLMDGGFPGYFYQVQEVLDWRLRGVLNDFGLAGKIEEEVQPLEVGGRKFVFRKWDVSCPAGCSLVKLNLALTKTVQRAGARVRSSVEGDAGSLAFEVGSRKFVTHRIVIRALAGTSASEGAAPIEGPKLAIVIDDFGYSNAPIVERFLILDLPLTIAVLPSLPYSRYVIDRARKMSKEVILHLPMEAENGEASDFDAVLTTMTDEEIAGLVERYLAENPGVAGVNNHMGSKATRDPRVMRSVLGVLRNHGLFFFDSLTSSKSVAYNTARRLGVGAGRNDLFLDADTTDPAVIDERLRRLVALARERGYAIGIGHPHGWTYEVIRKNESLLRDSDIRLVFVSALVE